MKMFDFSDTIILKYSLFSLTMGAIFLTPTIIYNNINTTNTYLLRNISNKIDILLNNKKDNLNKILDETLQNWDSDEVSGYKK